MGEYDKLAARAKERDVDAFAALYELVYEDMYHMAFYMLGNAHDAEDVVSETALAAFESIHKLRSVAAFKGWIFRILLNKCKAQRRAYVNRPLSVDEQTEGGVRGRELSREEALDVRRAFLKLPETERAILAMSLFGGYKSHEIGKHLHMNANTVRTRRSRALGKLHDMLAEGPKIAAGGTEAADGTSGAKITDDAKAAGGTSEKPEASRNE